MSFFQGTLQEGIASALQQSKSVVCFVTDGEAESRLWENEFFAEEEIKSLLQSQAVTLRLPAGSQEEGFLAQLYPIPKKPTVVIIKNAELKEYIAAGVSKEDFERRMKTALTPIQPAASQPSPMASPVGSPNQPSQVESSASSSGQATPPSPSDNRSQVLLAERAARVAEQRRKEEEAVKRQRAEKAKANAEAEATRTKKPNDQSAHAAALRKKQKEAREERQRILKAIEDDKIARHARQAELEAERRAAAAAEKAEKPDSTPFAPPRKLSLSQARMSEHCALQVRLFDSSTIRNRFSSSETLKDVRRWVDEARKDGKEPYVFKVLLTPLPSKTIDVTEEGKSLQELELTPSATLILLRVPKYTAAFASSASSVASVQGNVFQKFIAYILAIITGFFGAISTFVSTLFSTNGPRAAPEPASSQTSQSQTGTDTTRRRGNIAGVDHAERRRNEQQFYNGNSTNFEPRPDDGE